MKKVNRRKKEEADKRFGDLLRKQVNDHNQAANDTADADTLFAQLEDATVSYYCVVCYINLNITSVFCICSLVKASRRHAKKENRRCYSTPQTGRDHLRNST